MAEKLKINPITGKFDLVADLDSHLADTSNPHKVTLDQCYNAEPGEIRIINIDDGDIIFNVATGEEFKIQKDGSDIFSTDYEEGIYKYTRIGTNPNKTDTIIFKSNYNSVYSLIKIERYGEGNVEYTQIGTKSGHGYLLTHTGVALAPLEYRGTGIYPSVDDFSDLGLSSRRWKNLYLAGKIVGPVKVGSDTDHSNFASNGLLTLHGTARVKRNIEIAIGSIKPPATHPAGWSDLGIAGAWEFSDGTTETVILELPLPLDIDRTEDVVVEIAWSSPSTSGNCVWQLSYLLRSEDEAIDASADDTLTQTVAPSSTANGLVTTSFTIPAADISDTDKLLILRLERIGGDGNDTLGDVAYLTAMNLNYVSDKLGEAT